MKYWLKVGLVATILGGCSTLWALTSISPYKTFSREILTSADLNASFNTVITGVNNIITYFPGDTVYQKYVGADTIVAKPGPYVNFKDPLKSLNYTDSLDFHRGDIERLRTDTLTVGNPPIVPVYSFLVTAGKRAHMASVRADSDTSTVIQTAILTTTGKTTLGDAAADTLVVNGRIYVGTGTTALPIISGITDPNTGLNLLGNDTLSIVTGGSTRLRIFPAGAVGINSRNQVDSTLTDSGGFHVTGGEKIDGKATINILSTQGLTTLGDAAADTFISTGKTWLGAGTRVGSTTTAADSALAVTGGFSTTGGASIGGKLSITGRTVVTSPSDSAFEARNGATYRVNFGCNAGGNGVIQTRGTGASLLIMPDSGNVTFGSVASKVNPYADNQVDLGSAAASWDSLWLHVAAVVGDIPYLDNRDDIGAIKAIKGSGVIDSTTGLELVDDNTLPKEIMVTWPTDGETKEVHADTNSFLGIEHITRDTVLVRHKKGDPVRGPSGKPFYSLSSAIGQLQGAVRQLDDERITLSAWVWDLEKRVDSLRAEDATKGKRLDELEKRIERLEGGHGKVWPVVPDTIGG